jgi:hypothetical protein
MAVIEERAGLLADLVLSQLAAVASSDPRKLPGVPKDIDGHTAAALSSISVNPITFQGKPVLDPNTGEVLLRISYSFWNKLVATEQIGRHIGWFEKDNIQKPGAQVHGNVNIQQNNIELDISDIPREARREFVRAFARKRDQGDVVDVEAVDR